MYDSNLKTTLLSTIRGLLFILVSLIGMASILASNGGGGGSDRKAPTVDYSDLPTTPLGMSTSSTNTSQTDAALAMALGQMDLSDIDLTIANALIPFYLTSYSNEPCPDGGRSSLIINLANPNQLSNGDNYTASFSACKDSDLTADGSLSTEIINVGLLNQAGLSQDERFVGAILQLDYNNLAFSFSNEYEVIDGDMTLSGDNTQGYERVVISGTSIAVADNTSTTHMTDYTLWAGEDNAGTVHLSTEYTLASTILGGIFQVATLTPFEIASGDIYPSAGVLTVTGAAGNGIRLTTLDASQVQLDYEFNGDGQFNDHTVVMDWIDLARDSSNILVLKGQPSKPRLSFPSFMQMTP